MSTATRRCCGCCATTRPEGHQVRLRRRPVRRLHRASRRQRRCAPAQTPVSAVGADAVTTIEGIGEHARRPPRCRRPGSTLDVTQCGYCQAGQIMSATALLASNAAAHRRRHRQRHDRQHLPLRHLHAHPRRHQAGRRPARPKTRRCMARRIDTGRIAPRLPEGQRRSPAAACCCTPRLPRLAQRRIGADPSC